MASQAQGQPRLQGVPAECPHSVTRLPARAVTNILRARGQVTTGSLAIQCSGALSPSWGQNRAARVNCGSSHFCEREFSSLGNSCYFSSIAFKYFHQKKKKKSQYKSLRVRFFCPANANSKPHGASLHALRPDPDASASPLVTATPLRLCLLEKNKDAAK